MRRVLCDVCWLWTVLQTALLAAYSVLSLLPPPPTPHTHPNPTPTPHPPTHHHNHHRRNAGASSLGQLASLALLISPFFFWGTSMVR